MDNNGSFTYSSVVSVSAVNHRPVNEVFVYPNPTNNITNLIIIIDKKQTVTARIIDNSGKVLRSKKWDLSEGSTSIFIDMSGLVQGIYHLDISSQFIKKQISIIKQ